MTPPVPARADRRPGALSPGALSPGALSWSRSVASGVMFARHASALQALREEANATKWRIVEIAQAALFGGLATFLCYQAAGAVGF